MPSYRKGEGGIWLVVANFLVSEPLFLRSGNNVPINLHQTNVTFCSDKKGEGPKAQLSPSKVQAWLGEGGPVTLPWNICPTPNLGPPACAQAWLKRQISVGGSLRARSPDLPSCHHWGSQSPRTQLTLRPPKWRGPGLTTCVLCRLPLPLGHRDGDGREAHCCLKAWAWPWRGLWNPAGHSPQPVPWAPPGHLLCWP